MMLTSEQAECLETPREICFRSYLSPVKGQSEIQMASTLYVCLLLSIRVAWTLFTIRAFRSLEALRTARVALR
jgi:hypothetical protein